MNCLDTIAKTTRADFGRALTNLAYPHHVISEMCDDLLDIRTAGRVGSLETILGVSYLGAGRFRVQCANNCNFMLEFSMVEGTVQGWIPSIGWTESGFTCTRENSFVVYRHPHVSEFIVAMEFL